MGQVDIVPVRKGRELREFLDFPYRLYRGDPVWVPPLRIAQKELFDQARHPFYKNAEVQPFLAVSSGRTLGRIAAIHDRNFNEFHGEQAGFFGFFESVDDRDAARALLGAARDWLSKRGLRIVRGPMNPSTNYECGLLVEGFDSSPHIMMTYNPPYYAQLFQDAGLRKAKDLYAYGGRVSEISDKKAGHVEQLASANHVRVRSLRMKAFERELELFWEIYNSAWQRNWGFVPMTRDEAFFMAREMKSILVPDLVLFGEVSGETAAFALALPDINQALKHAGGRLFPLGLVKILYYKQFITSLRVITLGVREKYRTTGVAAALYAALIRHARRLGYKTCELSWVLEDNVLMNRSMRALGARRYKTYRIYEWNCDAECDNNNPCAW